jgi:hypothetical protein
MLSANLLIAAALVAAPGPRTRAAARQPDVARAAPPGSAAAAATVRGARPPGTGAVIYVTAGRIYVDAGAEDGLAEGVELELTRAGAAVGSCRVEALGPHHAICSGPRARVGDSFRFQAAPEPPAPRLLPPPPAEEVLATRRAVLEAAPVALVEARAQPAASWTAVRSRIADVAFTHASWTSSTAGPSHRESLDVVLRGAPITSWLVLDVDARAERWLRRQNPRFRPKDDTQLYVWQAQLTAAPSQALVLSAGRVLPWSVPGATVFDGAMGGLRGTFAGARAEAGVFGGVVPEPDTLEPTSERATGGAYWILDRVLAGGMALRHEGRFAVVRSPELGTRGEASLTGRFFLRRFDVSAEVHLGAGGEEQADALVDAARLDATFRPIDGLSVGGGFRYAGLLWPQPFEPPAFPGRSRQGELFVAYDLGPWVRIGANGGLSEDIQSGLDRKWFGPELSLPRLLGNRAAVTVGYLEERGWLDGRSAYAQVVGRPWAPLRLLLRVSWARDGTVELDRDELALYASASAEIRRYLGIRLSLHGRAAFGAGEGGDTPYGFTGFASVYSRF